MSNRKGDVGKTGPATRFPGAHTVAGSEKYVAGKGNNDGSRSLSGYAGRYSLQIIIFLFALFFIIAFSAPSLFINDEWITANQLNQLNIGHQITMNEGKYGVFKNGTPGPYFTERQNILMYNLALPVLALPIIKCFSLFADNFRLAIILLWAIIPLLIALLIDTFFPKYASIRGMRLTFGAILLSFVLLTTNLLLYTPFIFSAADAPVEVAAIIFTNHLLFAVIAVLAYQICLLIFEDRWKSLLGAFLCIACSSFVFWGSTAKEHMITATLFALVIYFFIRYLRRDSWWDAAGAFFCIGLLAWPRPEMGFTVAIGAGLFMIGYQAYRTTHGITDVKGAICAVFTAIFIFLGSIPLIVNNVITTGNPLVPLYILEETTTSHSRYAQVISPVTAVQNIPSVDPGIFSKIGDFAGIIGRHYVPSWNSLPSDIMGVFFYPETGHMGFTLVCPLAFIAVMLFLLTLSKRQRFPSRDKPILFFLFLMTLAVMITYLQSFQGMNTSHGITPDVRYLMPAYLTVGILGVYLLNFHGFPPSTGTTLSRLVKYSVVGVPLILVGIVALPPFGGRYDGYTLFFKMVITFLMVFFIAGFWFSSFRKEHIVLLTRCFLILIVFVLAWQMMMVFLYSVAKFNGYTFWIPLTDTIFHQVFGISITAP